MDLRIGRGEGQGTPWTVLADIAVAMVLVMVVYLVLQFLTTFREHAIDQVLVQRQHLVRDSLASAIPANLLEVDSLSPTRQRITFSSELLFESCRAELKPSGRQLMTDVAAVLSQADSYFEAIEIDGHTDSLPLRPQCRRRFGSNWELSTSRATSVVRLLDTLSVLSPDKLKPTGRAHYLPRNPNDLAQNRRIEVTLLYSRVAVESTLSMTPLEAP